MKLIGQNIYHQVSKFRNIVDFSKDVTFYQPVNNADPTISLGASDDERLKIKINYQGTGSQTAQIVEFTTLTESGTAHDGRFHFRVDEANILKIQDGGIDFFAGKGIGINGVDILTDNGSGTATLSNIDALDATTISTLNSALTAGDITGVTAGTGLSGGGASGAVTLNVDASQTQITAVGTIGTGVWQGTTIKTAYIGDDQVTEDKLANTLLAEIDANTAKTTNVTTNLSGTTSTDAVRINSSDGNNVIIAEASGSIAGVMTVAHHDKLDGIETSATADQSKSDIDGLEITTVGTIDTGVWRGTAIDHAYIGTDAIETDNIADAQVTVAKLHADAIQTSGESFADNDTSLMTSAAIDDAIIKGGSVTYINILPHEFLADEGGGANKSAQYDDTDAGGGDGAVDIGVSVGSTSASLFAFTDIPVGKTATHVTVFGSNAGNAITVYESNLKTGTLTSKGTGNTDTGDDSNIINITDVAGTSTNYLVIKSAIAATTNTIYGAQVTISG